jgi:hypothetical protein
MKNLFKPPGAPVKDDAEELKSACVLRLEKGEALAWSLREADPDALLLGGEHEIDGSSLLGTEAAHARRLFGTEAEAGGEDSDVRGLDVERARERVVDLWES